MNVDDVAAGKDAFELVALELVVTRAATHHHGLDVEVVQRVGHPVEQHAIVGDDFFGAIGLPGAALRITAAQVARRQHGLHTHVPQHRLRREANLREQPFAAAAGKVEHRLGVRRALRIADHRDVARILDVEQRARGLLRQIARHLLVDEVNHLRPQRRFAGRCRRASRLCTGGQPQHAVRQALRAITPADQHRACELDRFRPRRVQEKHRRCRAGIEFLLAHFAQQVAHGHADVAEVDVDRTRAFALVAHRAVVGDVGKLVPMFDGDAAPRLLFVQERLDQKRGGENLVARRIQQIGTRHVRRAHRLALAAAQAVLDRVGDRGNLALLHDQRFVPHQAEARRVRIRQRRTRHQFAAIEAAFRIDAVLIGTEGARFVVAQEFELGDADAVFAGDHAVERAGDRHDPRHCRVRQRQHGVVIGIDRNIGVHIAVAGVHVQGDEHAAAQHTLMNGVAFAEHRRECGAGQQPRQRRAQLGFPGNAN